MYSVNSAISFMTVLTLRGVSSFLAIMSSRTRDHMTVESLEAVSCKLAPSLFPERVNDILNLWQQEKNSVSKKIGQ